MVAYNGVLNTLVAVAPKIRRNPAESGGFRRIVDHTYYVLAVSNLELSCSLRLPPLGCAECPSDGHGRAQRLARFKSEWGLGDSGGLAV